MERSGSWVESPTEESRGEQRKEGVTAAGNSEGFGGEEDKKRKRKSMRGWGHIWWHHFNLLVGVQALHRTFHLSKLAKVFLPKLSQIRFRLVRNWRTPTDTWERVRELSGLRRMSSVTTVRKSNRTDGRAAHYRHGSDGPELGKAHCDMRKTLNGKLRAV